MPQRRQDTRRSSTEPRRASVRSLARPRDPETQAVPSEVEIEKRRDLAELQYRPYETDRHGGSARPARDEVTRHRVGVAGEGRDDDAGDEGERGHEHGAL